MAAFGTSRLWMRLSVAMVASDTSRLWQWPPVVMHACGICGLTCLGLGTEFRSEKIPRNRLETVAVIPRKKVLIPRHSGFRARANSEARNGAEWNDCLVLPMQKWPSLNTTYFRWIQIVVATIPSCGYNSHSTSECGNHRVHSKLQ